MRNRAIERCLGLAAFGMLIGIPAAAQVNVLRLDYVVVRESRNAQGQPERSVITRTRLLSSDGRLREETIIGPPRPMHLVEIHDSARDVHVQLNLNTKTATRRTGVMSLAERDLLPEGTPVGYEKADLGTALIQDFECRGTRLDLENGKQLEMWKCQDPVSGKEFLGRMEAKFPDGKLWREDLRQATPRFVVSPDVFEIPPDFQVVDK